MRESEKYFFCKRKYSKISIEKRLKLVQLVQEQNQAVTKAAKKLSIKLCTARIILKKFKETGKFPMKPLRKNGIRCEKQVEGIMPIQICGEQNKELIQETITFSDENVGINQNVGQQSLFTHFYYYFAQYQPFYAF